MSPSLCSGFLSAWKYFPLVFTWLICHCPSHYSGVFSFRKPPFSLWPGQIWHPYICRTQFYTCLSSPWWTLWTVHGAWYSTDNQKYLNKRKAFGKNLD
jgi:hypothetical protein